MLDKLVLEGEQQGGVKIVKKALEEPTRWISNNAGFDGSIVIDKIKNGKGSFGFDAAKEVYIDDMMAAGIIDPTKVARTALQNAASVASLLLTTNCMIADKPKDKGQQMPMMPPGGMGGMGGMDGMY
jgi:chaperonin GroEL